MAATLFLQPLGSQSFHCILMQNVVVWSRGTWLEFFSFLKGYLSQKSLRTTGLECIMALRKSSDKGLHFASMRVEWIFLLNNICILLTLKMKCYVCGLNV